MAEITKLEQGWSLYHGKLGSCETWTLCNADGDDRATFFSEPNRDRLTGYIEGWNAGYRNGVIAGRQQQAKLTSEALRTLIAGDVT